MENVKTNQVVDIRQSPQWGQYLEYLNWKKHNVLPNCYLYSQKVGPLTISKCQRPFNLDKDAIALIDGIAKENHLSFVKLEPSLNQDISLLTKNGFQQNSSPLCPPSTIFVDLEKSNLELEKQLSRSAKYSISRALREGGKVEFFIQPSKDTLIETYPAIKETAQRQHFFIPSFDDINVKARIWGKDCVLVVVRNTKKEIMGVKMFLGFNGNTWFMHGGTVEKARKTKFGYLLLWESINYLKSLGFKILDLEGKDDKRFPTFTKNWGGFSHFKEKFGGAEIFYPYPMIKIYSPILKTFGSLTKKTLPL